MQIRQLQVANDSIQDRLILRIATDANEEIRIFFTRRFLREIWPHLTAMLAGHLASAPSSSATSAEGEPANFDQPFRDENPVYPLGANPLLATEATLEGTDEGMARLTLREGCERRFSMNINAELLQALCAMLRAANIQAKWELTLEYGPPTPISNLPAKSFLH